MLLLACAFALAIAAVAYAKTVNDGNDTKGKIDIKKATFSKTKSGKYRIVVTFFDKVPPSGGQGNERIQVWKKKPETVSGCGGRCFKTQWYVMQGPQTGKQPVYYRCGAEGDPCTKTGTGKIERDGNKLTFTFPPKAVGSPKHKLFWHVESAYYGNNDECPTFDACFDKAPNGEGKVVKELL